jgi:RNA polymerase sigma-70 factor, ECF subfamily
MGGAKGASRSGPQLVQMPEAKSARAIRGRDRTFRKRHADVFTAVSLVRFSLKGVVSLRSGSFEGGAVAPSYPGRSLPVMAEPDITGLLRALSQGHRDALDHLMPIVYDELRRVAHRQLRAERPGHTLNTTALVHEAYLRLVRVDQVQWQDRAHFVAVAARVMRRILVDYARARTRDKRGGHTVRVPLVEALDVPVTASDELVTLDEALVRLEALNERQCRVVECRCFGGMSVAETAAALGTSPATVKRDWALSRAWLNRELRGSTTA